MDKMREEFEAWCDEQGYASDKYSPDDCGDKYKHLVGEYVISDTRLLWEAWEASRTALCVELPSFENGSIRGYSGDCDDARMVVDSVAESLDKAGVSYK